MPRPARRIAQSAPYIFQTLAGMKAESLARGVDVIDLGVGNPDLRPDPELVAHLHEALDDRTRPNHRYPPFAGSAELRGAAADWYQRRFGVTVDPDREVLPLIGTKEGIGHLFLALLDPGDTILVPSPAYPAYCGAAGIVEARVAEMPLTAQNGFRIDVAAIDPDVARAARVLIVNHPGNPTGACCDLDHYRALHAFAEEHDLVVVSDLAYAELTLDPGAPAPSFLEVPGARSRTLEFYSFSKTYNLAGWRVGFAAGSAELISWLARVKSNLDFGVFLAIQQAAARILSGPTGAAERMRETYRRRRDFAAAGLRAAGWDVDVPPATLYLWTRLPAGHEDSMAFVTDLFERSGVLLSPGVAFGRSGEGYVRLSLVADEERLDEAIHRMRASGVLG
jgi:LL-diaminopimelate aminotransferase